MDAVSWANPTDEQRELAAAIAELAADRCDSAHRREVAASAEQWDPGLWSTLGQELGLAGIAIPESAGGAGGDFMDAAVVVEEAARALLPVPITAHLAAAEALRGCPPSEAVEAVLGELAGGSAIGTLAVDAGGRAERVLHAGIADVFVVAAGDGLRVVRRGAAGTAVTAAPSLDLTRPHGRLDHDRSVATAVGDAVAAERAVDVLRVCLALEAVGVGRACLDMTVAYLKVREQFGRPIGSFQALQHRVADLDVELQAAISCARYAASVVTAWPDDAGETAVVAPLAKSVCAEAAYRIAAETIQLHGGIGFTWEHDAHLYFKRATALRALLGSPVEQRRLVAARAGISASGSGGRSHPSR